MQSLLDGHDLILAEAAIVEPLRRRADVRLHPSLVHAPLIYEERGAALLRRLYEDYIEVAQEAGLPFIMCTPTWRTDRQRVVESGCPESINRDAVQFLRRIRESQPDKSIEIKIGGLIGCRHDAYRPVEGLSASEAASYHSWQIEELAAAGVDFLIAETIPSVDEAVGIARAMAAGTEPYLISFVINREGRVLDGTALAEAVERVDSAIERRPLGYMINCAYPTFLRAEEQPPALLSRLVGCLANASSLDHCDLEGSERLQSESVEEWAGEMLALNRNHGIKVLGGCCGTGVEHLRQVS